METIKIRHINKMLKIMTARTLAVLPSVILSPCLFQALVTRFGRETCGIAEDWKKSLGSGVDTVREFAL